MGLSGDSYLAMSQYAVAGIRPPHLAAIAPWEGAFSPYKDTMARGGIVDLGFNNTLTSTLFTKTGVEDVATLMKEHPFYDEYWMDKEPDIENVEVPAYVVASWTNAVHSQGSIQAFLGMGSKEKWLRISNTHEWTDYYNPKHVEDLRKFFDCYLKGIDNGWENTPKIRMSVLNPGHEDIVDRPENEFPVPVEKDLYLNQKNGELVPSTEEQAEECAVSYDVSDLDGVRFGIKMDEDMEWIGYGSMKLFVETDAGDDMDVYAYVRKRDVNGNMIEPTVVTDRFYPGPNGQLRVSSRKLDEEKSTALAPKLLQTGEEKISPNQIVPIEIPFWPFGMKWEAGETLEVQICPIGKIVRPEFPQIPQTPSIGKGKQIIHFGGKYDSKLRIPVVK